LIKLSCADYTWPALRHSTVLSIISDLGFAGVDIGVFADATHITVDHVTADPEGKASELAAQLSRESLVVSDVFLTPSLDLAELTPTNPDAEDQAKSEQILTDTLKFAKALGTSGVTLLPGVVDPGVSHSQAIRRASKSLQRRVELASVAGLELSVEPHFGSCINTPNRTAELLDQTPGLTLTLDPGHFVFSGSTLAEMSGLLDRTRHVQVRPGAPGVMQARVSENGFDIPYLVDALRDHEYSGWLAAEYVWMEKWGCDRVDNTMETHMLKLELQRALEQLRD
jgi:sugar phosphate isomerase/epimerase